MGLTGGRPYFIRAVHEWIIDRGFTPYLMVDADWPGAHVPRAHVEEGRIVLNIKASAVRDLELGNDHVSFSARFAGQTELIHVPVASVLGIYARENGEGMFFDPEEYPRDPVTPEPASPAAPTRRPALRVVK